VTDQLEACVICASRPRWAARVVCAPCYLELRQALATLPEVYDWLGVCMVSLPASWRTSTIRGSLVDAPAPMPLELADARARISDRISFWVQAVLEAKRPQRPGPAEPTVASAAAWLIRQLGWITRQPAAETFARDLADLHRHAQGSAPWDGVRRDLPGTCPSCGCQSLSFFGGDSSIRCRIRDCAALLSWAQYEQLVQERLAKASAPGGSSAA